MHGPAQDQPAPTDAPATPAQAPPSAAPTIKPTIEPDGFEVYNRVAETVGLVPNLRLKDNLVQLGAVVVGVILGAGAGAAFARSRGGAGSELLIGAGAGALLGFIVFGVLSGVVLMVVGWVRALKGWRKQK
ncbi:MAG: hypothetical protein IT431_02455 [Phycisphaerales bacterium]|nr:hypothetical protein [Phycisphaerales bacterium]